MRTIVLIALALGFGTVAVAHAQTPSPSPSSPSPSSSRAVATPSASTKPTARVPNPIVIPPYATRIRAGHRVHAEQAKMLCKDCHAGAWTSHSPRDWLGPSAAQCEGCHTPKHAELSPDRVPSGAECLFCHIAASSFRAPPASEALSFETGLERRPAAHLHFSHALHARRNIGCAKCHGPVSRGRDADGTEMMPRKPICVKCHRSEGRVDGEARGTCITCHESAGAVIRTRFEGQQLLPSSATPALEHGPSFRFSHGAVAGNDPRQCRGCHTERSCQECHDGRLRPRSIHPSDWLRVHAIATKQGNDCESCHRLQSFCLSCHERLGLSSSGAASALGGHGAVHPPPPVWTTGPMGPRHHGAAARRNLTECVSCHQERDCIRCHATGSMGGSSGGSPHPPHFADGCREVWQRNPRACVSCHGPQDPVLSRCF